MPESSLDAALLDAVSEAISAGFIVYDRNDQMIFASRAARSFVPVDASHFEPGTRLRDFLAAAYDAGHRAQPSGPGGEAAAPSRDEWLTGQIAAHWKERYEIQVFEDGKRWVRYSKRRLPSGFGFCVMSDITEQKRREEQWRIDMERVQLTEEILDNLAHPVFVQDRNLQLVAVNKAFCSALSLSAETVLGGPLLNAFDAELTDHLTTVSKHVLETGVTASLPLPMRLHGDLVRPILVHVQRVGKPGRYLIVASFGEMGTVGHASMGEQQTMDVPQPPALQKPAAGSAIGRLAGRKALLVTSDRDFEAGALDILQILGLDSCCVRSEAELDAFLGVARSVGVNIDLAVVDAQMDLRCLELIQSVDIDYITLAGPDIASDLAFLVLDRLTALQPLHLPADDWEITTDPEPEVEIEPLAPQPSLVLVAEDNEINQIVFSQILEGLGYTYRICANGEEVVRLWAQLRPAVILMDVTLPGINGFEAARRIREQSGQDPDATPIIGVLPLAFDRDREACYASGMNDVILKPLSPDVVDQALLRQVPDIARLASIA